ncbi:caspase family protein [Pseudooceanicola sp. C21-150M6]|uniref:caspase family protein n=1 Tax=Pseudooceanicola sp. C21-150M6 TaxID=3434355 RepID=UPI003D7F51D0
MLLPLLCLPLRAADRALLVGVTDYPLVADAGFQPLLGPKNDLRLMQQSLAKYWPDATTTTLGEPERPATRDNILSALATLADAAGAQDRILIYLSGHGAQIPAPPEALAETDGMDEIFLPSDIEIIRQNGRAEFHNAIRDDEIGQALDQMLDRDAEVWLIVDACHSGSLDRSAPLVARAIDPLSIAAPDRPVLPAAQTGATVQPDRMAAPRLIAFYAAAPSGKAYERPVTTQTGATTVHGVFTLALSRAMARVKGPSFSDLAQATAAEAWRLSAGKERPVFSGALNRASFVSAPQLAEPAYGLTLRDGELVLAAGRLDGIGQGAVVTIEAADADGPDGALARARVETAGPGEAVLSLLLPPDGAPDLRLDRMIRAENLDPDRVRLRWIGDRAPLLQVRLEQPGPGARLALFTPPDTDAAHPELMADLRRLTQRWITWSTDEEADIRLEPSPDGLVLTRRGAPPLTRTFPAGPGQGDAISRALATMARAALLRDLPGSASGMTDALDMQVLVRAGQPGGGSTPCANPASIVTEPPPDARPLPADTANALAACDAVYLRLRNLADTPLDVSPFYVDAEDAVYFLTGYPGGDRQGLRLPPRTSRVVAFTEDAGTAPGQIVDLVALAVPARPGPEPVRDFRHLAGRLPDDADPSRLDSLVASAEPAATYRGAAVAPDDFAFAAVRLGPTQEEPR